MNKRTLLLALFLLAFGGLLLHMRIHWFLIPDRLDPSVVKFDITRLFAFVFPLMDVVVVTALFARKDTAAYGYLLNGLLVIFGTVMMAHFSIAGFIAENEPPRNWLMKSTLPDIAIAWADFMVGKALYESYAKPNPILEPL